MNTYSTTALIIEATLYLSNKYSQHVGRGGLAPRATAVPDYLIFCNSFVAILSCPALKNLFGCFFFCGPG